MTASRSDDSTRQGSSGFRFAGSGHQINYRCMGCQQPIPNLGRKQVRVRGVKGWLGKCCIAKQVAK